jgi:nucleoside-diphosphate-sugar epimerase
MLLERGAKKVISFDIVPAPEGSVEDQRIEYVVGDIRDEQTVVDACKGADCVWHIAAAVGPYHPKPLYEQVNYEGSLNVLEACRQNKCSKLVMSSSPSTRFKNPCKDVDGETEDELPSLPQKSYLAEYAKTKAMGEKAVTDACCDNLMTVAIAPHQVYGPRDNLFLPNLLEAAGTGSLRIFGDGKNRICFSHVDNYCHGLILGEKALYVFCCKQLVLHALFISYQLTSNCHNRYKGSPALGKFYIITDGDTHTHPEGYALFWEEIDKAIVGVGFPSLWEKF